MSRSRGRVVRSERKWTVVSYDMTFAAGTGGNIVNIPLSRGTDQNSAEEGDYESTSGWQRMTRLIGAFACLPGLTNPGVDAPPFLALGLVRANSSNTEAFAPLSVVLADRPWLFREYWPLPLSFRPQEVHSCKLDWQLRGGRGTNIDRDVELRLCGQTNGVTYPGAATLTCRVMLLQLGEDTP